MEEETKISNMENKSLFTELNKTLTEFFKPISDKESLVPKAEQVIEQIQKLRESSDSLVRYRQIRDRMPRRESDFIGPPNYTYSLHSS